MWRVRVRKAELTWALAFAAPYLAVFLAFVIYPVCYGLYLGADVNLYRQVFGDPRYLMAAVNTLIYLIVGVNVNIALAFLLSGFFLRKGWYYKALFPIFMLPWATPSLPAYMSIHWFVNGQWGMLNNALYLLFGINGPIYLNDRWPALACNITAYIWKNMPFWTIILMAGRLAIPLELYEAATVDGATGLRMFRYITVPLMTNLYLVCVLLDSIFVVGDFNSTFFVSGGGPAMTTEVLATLAIRYAFTTALPRVGVATVMTALPVLILLIVVLMRRLRMSKGQL